MFFFKYIHSCANTITINFQTFRHPKGNPIPFSWGPPAFVSGVDGAASSETLRETINFHI